MSTRNETKKASIERMLRDPATVRMSDGNIAKKVKSSYTHVSKTRRDLELAGEIEILPTLYREDGTALDRSEVAARRRLELDREGTQVNPHGALGASSDGTHVVEAPTPGPPARDPDPIKQPLTPPPGPGLVCPCSSADDLDRLHALLGRVAPPRFLALVWDASTPPPLPALGALSEVLTALGLEPAPMGIALGPGDIAFVWERTS